MTLNVNPERELFKNIPEKTRRKRLELIADADTFDEKLRIQELPPDDVEREWENHIFPTYTEIPDRIDPDTGENIYD